MAMHLADDDLGRLAQKFSGRWESYPRLRWPLEPGALPWPIHIFRGILVGWTKTKGTGREYGPDEITWAWNSAAEIAEQSDHLSESNRQELLERVQRREPGRDLFSKLVPPIRFVTTLTGRLRGYPSYCAARNTVFQGLAADGAKLALYRLHRESFRVVNFIHDEVIVELPEQADHTALAEQIKRIMVDEMRRVVPDIPIECEYALMRRWHKGAEAVYENERLVPSMPISHGAKTVWTHDRGDHPDQEIAVAASPPVDPPPGSQASTATASPPADPGVATALREALTPPVNPPGASALPPGTAPPPGDNANRAFANAEAATNKGRGGMR